MPNSAQQNAYYAALTTGKGVLYDALGNICVVGAQMPAGAAANNVLVSDASGNLTSQALPAASMPAATTSTQGAVVLDGSAADLAASGAAAAGATGKAADGGHAHPDNGFTPSDAGLLAWNYDIGLAGNAAAPSNNVVNLIRINIRQAISVTNVILGVTTAGVGLTSGQNFAGIYNSSGTLIGTTADQSGNWNSAGLKTMALTGGPFALAAGTFIWVAVVTNFATSGPLFPRSCSLNQNIPNAGFTVSTARWATNGTATTALANSITPSSNVLAGVGFWAALS